MNEIIIGFAGIVLGLVCFIVLVLLALKGMVLLCRSSFFDL
jgi:hypothetical protein